MVVVIIAVVLVVLVGVGLLLRFTLGAAKRRAEVLQNGQPGVARILGWERTGMAEGPHDILRFAIMVRPVTGGPEFQATADRCVRPMDAPQFQVGMERPVRWLHDAQRVRVEFE